MKRLSTCLLALTIVAPAATFAEDVAPGKVIIARASEDAIVLYDASPEVVALVHDRVDAAAARVRLERDALAVLAKVLPDLSEAKSVTVRVTYVKNADVNPAYGTPTFAGIERYANLKATVRDAKGDRSNWSDRSGHDTPPAWATFTIVGELPPS